MQVVDQICERLTTIRTARVPVGYDLEGDYKCVTVCSFATSPFEAISIPLRAMDFSRLWSEVDEARLVRAVGDVLEDPQVVKVAHNMSYEQFTHRWLYGHIIRNMHDSMIAWNVALPELLKDLSVVASVLTRTNYWGTPDDWITQEDRDTYNAIDSCVCLEAWQRLMAEFTPAQLSYYRTQCALLEPCGEMAFSGMLYDAPARDALVTTLLGEVYASQGRLDALAGIQRPTYAEVRDVVAMKIRHPVCADWSDLLQWAKPSMRENL